MKMNATPYRTLDLIQGTPEWLAVRSNYVTASEVPIILGLSKYQTIADLVRYKLWGIEKERNEFAIMAMQRGHDAEPVIRAEVERVTGLTFAPAVLVSNNCPALLASLDGYNAERGINLEAKLLNKRDFQTLIKKRVVRADHLAQVQAQLIVTGADQCIYAVASPDGDLESMSVKPDLAYAEKIQARVSAFGLAVSRMKETLSEIEKI